jgi:hypothetical protein
MSWRGVVGFDTFSAPDAILNYRKGEEMSTISGYIFPVLHLAAVLGND